MRLYAEYLKERENIEMIHDDHCFIAYKIDGDEVMIHDIYADQEVRATGYMLKFCLEFQKVLEEKGVKKIYSQTDERTNGWERSDFLMKKQGFSYLGKDPDNKSINNYYIKIGMGE